MHVAGLALLAAAAGADARPLLAVAITGYPSDPTTSTEATFAFSADSRDASFRCSLDEARPTPCTSPLTLRGLSLGRHRFGVTAVWGREQASTSHTWTIVAVQPRSEPLVVSVRGGGRVTGPGISCPGDCTETYAVGTQVQVAPHPGAGFGFAGWGGACAGRGTCATAIQGRTFLEARFERTAKPRALLRGDADGDDVADALDLCPGSPRGGKLLLRGCSLADLVHDGAALLEAYDWPGAYAPRFRGIASLRPIQSDLRRHLRTLRRGAGLVQRGDVCEGAATVRNGARGLAALVGTSGRLIHGLQAAVLREPSGGVGDASMKELEWSGLNHRLGIVQEIAREAGEVRRAYAAGCASLGKRLVREGIVDRTDDAHGQLHLGDGTRVQLPTARHANLYVGARVRVVGRRGPGPALFAEALTTLGPKPAKAILSPCVSLRIAPVQPITSSNPILHSPVGYRSGGVLQLEQGMRLAASPEQCADAAAARYSISIEASAPGVPAFSIAGDLVAADGPVPLGLYDAQKLWTVTVTHRRQKNSCPPPGDQPQPFMRGPASVTKSYPCPVVVLGTTIYKARVRPFASYARAVYATTVFDLESNAYDRALVKSLADVHPTLSSPSFQAQAYAYLDGAAFQEMSTISVNNAFAIWPEAWYGFPLLFPIDTIGVGHYAGLIWPRVVGLRNGKPYRYAAQLPRIVTDLLPNCPASNCFYRLPWEAGDWVVTGQGNGPGGASHNGTQQYAFDFSMPDKSTIHATRGGVVGDVVESNAQNFNPCADNNENGIAGDAEDKLADGPSNYVRIDHPGGRYSFYAHVDANSVIPPKGALVERGDPLAKVDNTGRSCGPHLHYQVASDSTNTIYGQTVPICFEGWTFVPFSYSFSSCFVPQTSDLVMSTNG
jgi:murein DD-endopeptidase MepM/ murein hydrolase activator NlpD